MAASLRPRLIVQAQNVVPTALALRFQSHTIIHSKAVFHCSMLQLQVDSVELSVQPVSYGIKIGHNYRETESPRCGNNLKPQNSFDPARVKCLQHWLWVNICTDNCNHTLRRDVHVRVGSTNNCLADKR